MEKPNFFRFRRFEVRNDRSAMKVNTDGVLLGALMTITGKESRLLDIGTGTGTVALMAAQRLSDARSSMAGIRIDAIDIDEASAKEAGENFSGSPWPSLLHAHHCPLSGFRPELKYDLIFSNPPFFTEELHSPSERKARARHSDALPLDEIMDFAADFLAEDGRLSLILPSGRESDARLLAGSHGLRLNRAVDIHGSDRKSACRVITEFSRDGEPDAPPLREKLAVNSGGKYSERYLEAVSDFLLIR